MSCSNLTSGIAKGCNDQVGGLEGIHYKQWDPTDTIIKDANGVIVYWGPTYDRWNFIEADNGQANLTETYEFGNGASVLGFNQSLNFFIPDTARPSISGNYFPYTVQNWVGITAPQNKMAVIAETQKQTIVRGYRPKCFGFGMERGAYVASGNKQTGVNYTDNNGYTIEFAAKSKEPMDEVDFMVQHLGSGLLIKPSGNPPIEEIWQTTAWNYTPLVNYLGANVRVLNPGILVPEIWVQPGQLITYKAQITAIWSQNCWSGGPGTFQLTANGRVGGATVPATITNAPYTYFAGAQQTLTVEWSYEYTGSTEVTMIPLQFGNAVDPNLPITEAGNVPTMDLQIFAQTT